MATTFASNIARLQTLADAARQWPLGRLMGRAIEGAMVRRARKSRRSDETPLTALAREALDVPRENLMLIVRGHGRAPCGLARSAAALSRPRVEGGGHFPVFLPRPSRQTEVGVARIKNALVRKGSVDVIDDSHGFLTTLSGHANRSRPRMPMQRQPAPAPILIPNQRRVPATCANMPQLALSKGMTGSRGGQWLAGPSCRGNAPRIVEYIDCFQRPYL